MVFILRHVHQGETLILGPVSTYSMGRSRKNNIHLRDVTVDKRHATLKIEGGHADIEDNDTDFGTYVNKQQISEPFRLRNGDVIVFGKSGCKYVFFEPKYEAVVDPTVSNEIRGVLEKTLNELDISLSENYSTTSSHFVIESVSLTTLKEKTILYYLIERKTVITPKYFLDILTNIKEAPLTPNIYRYMPDIDNYLKSRGIEDINPRKNRRHIFEYIAFIFFDKQCDDDLCDLIVKCGGEAIVCNQKKNFYHNLLSIMNGYKYIAVNHNNSNKKTALMYNFLRTMKQKRKKVAEVNADDVYVSVLKGELVGVCETSLQSTNPKEPHPGSSKTTDCVVVNCSEDEISGAESEPVDIVCKVIKDGESSGQKDKFGRRAAAYKQSRTLREVMLQNNERSPTLNNWISRKKRKDKILNHKEFENGVTSSSTLNETGDSNKDKPMNASSNKEVDYDKLQRDLEDIFGTSEDTNEKNDARISPITKKKRKKSINNGAQETVQNGGIHSSGANLERLTSKINGKKKSVVINPFAIGQTPKVDKEERSNDSSMEKWSKKYKHVEIIPSNA